LRLTGRVEPDLTEGLRGRATTRAGVIELQRRFCEALPEDLLWVENPETGERLAVVPGELRGRDVKVGRHIPVSAGALPRFLERFERVYAGLWKTDSILADARPPERKRAKWRRLVIERDSIQ
jgi:hypothetical protein